MAAKVKIIFACCQILFFAEIRIAISKTLTCGDYRVLDSGTTYKLENRGNWPCSMFFNIKNSCTPRLMCNKFDVAAANSYLEVSLTHPIKFNPSFRQQIQLTIDRARILGILTLGIGPARQVKNITMFFFAYLGMRMGNCFRPWAIEALFVSRGPSSSQLCQFKCHMLPPPALEAHSHLLFLHSFFTLWCKNTMICKNV